MPLVLAIAMCLHPLMMYDTGTLTDSGKHRYTFKPPVGFPAFGIPVPCGKCIPCLERRRNEWCKRISLESLNWPCSSFITLTYDDAHLPLCRMACKRHIQNFVKRLRHMSRDYDVPSSPFKYFIVSEYGSKRNRPHYHGIVFGVDFLLSPYRPRLVGYGRYPYFTSDVLVSVWQHGFCMVDRLSPASIRYVSKYITKQDKSRPTWSLKSIGLAKSLFVDDFGLTSLGRASLETGFVSVPSRSDPVRVRTPSFLDQYAERFAPSLFEDIKASRRDYLKSLPCADISLAREVAELNHSRETLNRTLDNET